MFDKEIIALLQAGERHYASSVAKHVGVPEYLIQGALDKLVRDNAVVCGELAGRRVYSIRTISAKSKELDERITTIEGERVSGHVPTDPTAIIDVPSHVRAEQIAAVKWSPGKDPWALVGDAELGGSSGNPPVRSWVIEALGWEPVAKAVTKEEIAKLKTCDSPIRWMGGKSELLSYMIERFPEHYGYVEVFGGSLKPFFAKRPAQVEVVNDKYEALINFWRVCSQWPKELTDAVNAIPSSRIIHRLFGRDVHREYRGYDPVDRFQRAVMFGYLNRVAFNGKVWDSYSGSIHVAQPQLDERKMVAAAERMRYAIIECQDFRDLIKRYCIKKADGPILVYLDPPYVNTTGYKIAFPDEWHKEIADLMVQISEAGNFFLLSNSSHAEKLYFDRWRGVAGTSSFRLEKRNVRYSVGTGYSDDETEVIDHDEEILVSNFAFNGRQGRLL